MRNTLESSEDQPSAILVHLKSVLHIQKFHFFQWENVDLPFIQHS